MLSRVANLVYWLARYLERADNSARIVDVNTQFVLDVPVQAGSEERAWDPIILASGDDKLFRELYPQSGESAVIDFVLFNQRNPNSVISCINQARENARCIREQLSTETWEQLNRLYLELHGRNFADYQRVGSTEFLNRIRLGIQLFYGIAGNMLPQNEAWHFYNLGRFLERADNTSRLIDVKYFALLPSAQDVGTALDTLQWGAVLRSCSAFEAFRKSRRGQITIERVVDYLILDEVFPRSIRFSITHAEEAIRQVTQDSDHHFSNRPTRTLGRLRADLDYATMREIISAGLHEWIDHLQVAIGHVHEDIQKTFFFYDVADLPR